VIVVLGGASKVHLESRGKCHGKKKKKKKKTKIKVE